MPKRPRARDKDGKLTGVAAHSSTPESAMKNIIRAYELEKEAGELLLKSDICKEKAFDHLHLNNRKHMDVEHDNLNLRFQIITRTTVKYDINALKMRLKPEIMDEILERKYSVLDIDKLKSIMREYGVPANILKECLEISESVDNKRIDELFEEGYITLDDLKGCYALSDNRTMTIKEK